MNVHHEHVGQHPPPEARAGENAPKPNQISADRKIDCFRIRLREAGIVLFHCALDGELVCHVPCAADASQSDDDPQPPRHPYDANDWLAELFLSSPLFQRCVKEAAAQWSLQDEPHPLEVFPGAWLVAIPTMSRRRRAGYAIALIPTEPILDAEQLSSMCQSAGADFTLTRHQLEQLPPAPASEVPRLAALVHSSYIDHVRSLADAQSIESVGKQLAESFEELHLLLTITQTMQVQEQPERFIARACKELLGTLPYAWIGLQLADDRDRLKSMAGRLIVAGDSGQPAGLIRSIAQALLTHADSETPMVLQPGVNPKHAAFAPLGQTVLVQPLANPRDHEVLGLLVAGNKRGPDSAPSNIDLKLLGATATHMAIFLENAALYHDLNSMFIGTLEALTASIDAKDRYTCGHSRRVAHLTQELARRIGLDDRTVSRCHIAGLVHDVGKIGVPEAVLLKPGKLTNEEFAWIRKHPEIGHRILKDIPQLNDILPGVLYHHERWDGKGYPHGLSGEGIPLLARLIGLADAFDAMSSNRTYRSALTRSQVLKEIEKCAGSQFDPELAEAFLTLDFQAYDQMAREHQMSEQQFALKEKAA